MSLTSTEIRNLAYDAGMSKISVLAVIFLLLLVAGRSYGTESPSSLEVSIPDYKVTTVGNVDYAVIPGGEILVREEGRPRVPYYVKSIDYPIGYRVQDVILEERSGLRTATGLRLPVVALNVSNPPPEMKMGWYPEEEYSWRVWDNPNGTTMLMIAMYPFYYNPETTEVKFYTLYRFDIAYVLSNVAITGLDTDKDVYELGDKVTIDMWLNNTGDAQDVIVNPVIRQYATDTVVEGLPLRSLTSLLGEASYSTDWSTGETEPGQYYVEATITDTSGNVLDRKTVAFSIYGDTTPPFISYISQTPSSDLVQPGEDVTVRATVYDINSGVGRVTLSYRYSSDNGSTWSAWADLPMNPEAVYGFKGTIPGFQAETRVQYKISAVDNRGNAGINDAAGDYYVYTVVPELPSPFLMPLLVVVIALALVLSRNQSRLNIRN
jgi:hypothetical protein